MSFKTSRGTMMLIFGVSGIILIIFGTLVLAQAYGIWNVGYNPQTVVQITATSTATATSATNTSTNTSTSATGTSTSTSTTTTTTPPCPTCGQPPPLYYLIIGWGLCGLGVVAEAGTFALRPTHP